MGSPLSIIENEKKNKKQKQRLGRQIATSPGRKSRKRPKAQPAGWEGTKESTGSVDFWEVDVNKDATHLHLVSDFLTDKCFFPVYLLIQTKDPVGQASQ